MKNYSKITENKDILTKEYADSTYANKSSVNNGTLTIQKNGEKVQTFSANQSSSVTANITVPTKASDVNALSLDGGTINKSKTIKMDASANSDGANLKWGTVNHKNPYIGYASDQSDGTFVVGSLLGTNYASGLAIGGGSGNLLWKGTKVATTNDIPAAVTESTVSGWGFTKNTGTITGIKMNDESKGTSGVIDLGTVITAHQSIKSINTSNTTAQDANASEAIAGSGTINLHKIAKTGNYSDLLNKPSNATQSIAGLMSVEDKKKLDGIATGANAYVLPSANSDRLGGIKISFSNGVLTITT